jgi:hypothetical protein
LPIPFRYYSNVLQDLLGAFPNVPGMNLSISFTFPLKEVVSVLLRLKIEDATEKFKKPSAVLLLIMIYPTLPPIDELKLVREFF